MLTLLLASLFLMSSCVTSKKYKELELVKEHYKTEYESAESAIEQKKALQTELQTLRASEQKHVREKQQLEAQMMNLEMSNADLKRRYDLLLSQNKTVINSATDEKQNLREELAATQAQLDEQERKLDALKYVLDQREADLYELKADLDVREQKVNDLENNLANGQQKVVELESILQSRERQMADLRSTVDNALRGFTTQDMSVTEREGKLYVSLSQDLLFSKGSDVLDFEGRNAIKQLAGALATTSDFNILVEGHTDSDGSAARNWELSANRAVSVVKELVADGIAPERITAAGRGLYAPIAPNDTDYNKARNRRTDIILSPKLDVLYELIGE